MSLLDTGNETVVVYLEEEYEDGDGNAMTRASKIGIVAKVRMEIQGQSGTSSRRQETAIEGFESEKVYTMKFPRSWPHVLGAQSQVEWMGERWTVFGDVQRYNRSRRTAHLVYTIKRF